jgi:adenine-specific DNA-methyltransferase
VALSLARTRLMEARYPYYLLADSPEGRKRLRELGTPATNESERKASPDIHLGFVYRSVPHVTLGSIANNPDIHEEMTRAQIDAAIKKHADSETLYDQPYEDKGIVRVSGPFTVESLSPHRELPQPAAAEVPTVVAPDVGNYLQLILDNLRKAGVKGMTKQQRMTFARLDSFPGTYIQAEGTTDDGLGVRISVGPELGTVGDKWIKEAALEAIKGSRPNVLLVCAFSFEASIHEQTAELSKEIQFGTLRILPVRMNPDLAMFGDATGQELLKKTGAANLFTVFGEPDLKVETKKGKVTVTIRGLDVFDPTTGEVRTGGTDDIACWFIDTDYDGQSFFVRQAYFCGADEPYEKLKKALRAEIDEGEWSKLYSATSQPFDVPKSGRIAVKVINHYGDEIIKVVGLER